jgi:hypothetical protein
MTRYPLGRSDDMSEGTYQAMCDWEAESDLAPLSLSESRGWWRTRDGRVLRIVEMEDEHLENAIGLFELAGWGEHPKVLELKDERTRR